MRITVYRFSPDETTLIPDVRRFLDKDFCFCGSSSIATHRDSSQTLYFYSPKKLCRANVNHIRRSFFRSYLPLAYYKKGARDAIANRYE